jgi:hypothetical protein
MESAFGMVGMVPTLPTVPGMAARLPPTHVEEAASRFFVKTVSSRELKCKLNKLNFDDFDDFDDHFDPFCI